IVCSTLGSGVESYLDSEYDWSERSYTYRIRYYALHLAAQRGLTDVVQLLLGMQSLRPLLPLPLPSLLCLHLLSSHLSSLPLVLLGFPPFPLCPLPPPNGSLNALVTKKK